MGRLIDADLFKQQIAGMALISPSFFTNKVVKLLEIIDEQPTAFDVEAIIKELQETNKNLCDHIICCKEKCCEICTVNNFLREQIEIIRRGGVKND